MSEHLPKNINEHLTFNKENFKEIYVAGGCYWGTQAYMDRIKGVYKSSVGFANGVVENPTYEEVCLGDTGHAETTYIVYDTTYTDLLTILESYFETINPTTINRQGLDRGTQYRSGIYYTNESDLAIIKGFIDDKQKDYAKEIVVEVLPLNCYYIAHEEHQKYLEKNKNGYCHVNLDILREKEQ
ncbi:MAG: peptide-methionine (S)-S-oxide reductase MsrA [Lachnospirales bacterium]